MLVKVNNQFLQLSPGESLEIERSTKVFEDAVAVSGDFSYQSAVVNNSHNRNILGLLSVNESDKTIYGKVPAVVMSDDGVPVYFGRIKVEGGNKKEIKFSFFSGNSNWFAELSQPLSEYDFSSYNIDFDRESIDDRFASTSGIVFPLINHGALPSRSYFNMLRDDYHPWVYVSTVIQTIFNKHAIKLKGDILNDWKYINLITSNNRGVTPQEELNDRNTSVNRSTTQVISTAGTQVTFPNFTGDYFTGDLWNSSTNEFTADKDMLVNLEFVGELSGSSTVALSFLVNGTTGYSIANEIGQEVTRKHYNILLLEGDVLTVSGTADSGAGDGDLLNASLKITVVRVYQVFTGAILPNWSAKDFVCRIFALFNPLIDYNPMTKELTVDLFKKLSSKEELDISQYIESSSIEEDYTELISNYGKLNNFRYSEASGDATEDYNGANTIPYGGGQIDSENENTEAEVTVIDSEFIATIEDTDNPFSVFLPHLDWRELEEVDPSDDSASADNSAGLRFTASGFTAGDLVRITDSTVEEYNGDWVVSSATATTFRVIGLGYSGNATLKVTRLLIGYKQSDEQALLLFVNNPDIEDFTRVFTYYIDTTTYSDTSTAYFHKPLQGIPRIDTYKDSLSFGEVIIPNTHQRNMLMDYWRDFERIVKDPVKLKATGHFPKVIFDQLFNTPLRLKANDFNLRLLANKATGYKGSHLPCEVELIKL